MTLLQTTVRGRCCPPVGRACFFFPCSCLCRCGCVDVIGCACCLNENSWLIPVTAVCSLYIPTFFRDFNANVRRFNNILVPLCIQSAVSCPYSCLVTVQQPDSPQAQVSCVVVSRLMSLTAKAVIIVIAAAKPMKYPSGYQEDVMSSIRQTVRSKVCQEGRRERVV